MSSRSVPSFIALALLTLTPAACDSPAPGAGVDPTALERDYEALATDLDRRTGARQITVATLREALRRGREVVLVDVREPREQQVSTLPDAILTTPSSAAAVDVPSGGELEGDEPLVVTYCTAGYRSGVAAVELERRLGAPVFSLHGGIIAWFNAGGRVVAPDGAEVDRIDPYSEEWRRYLRER